MGAITEGYIGHPVSGVSVEISFSELRNATYSLGYTILGTATTDSEGAYSYAFERVAAVNYRVRCTKDGYLLHEEIVHTDDWRVKTENMLDIEMFVESSLNFRLVNTSHPSSQVLLRLEEHSQGCDFCCSHDATIRVAGINDRVQNHADYRCRGNRKSLLTRCWSGRKLDIHRVLAYLVVAEPSSWTISYSS